MRLVSTARRGFLFLLGGTPKMRNEITVGVSSSRNREAAMREQNTLVEILGRPRVLYGANVGTKILFYRCKFHVTRLKVSLLSYVFPSLSPSLLSSRLPISIRRRVAESSLARSLPPIANFSPRNRTTMLTKRSGKYRIFKSGSSTNPTAILMFPSLFSWLNSRLVFFFSSRERVASLLRARRTLVSLLAGN